MFYQIRSANVKNFNQDQLPATAAGLGCEPGGRAGPMLPVYSALNRAGAGGEQPLAKPASVLP